MAPISTISCKKYWGSRQQNTSMLINLWLETSPRSQVHTGLTYRMLPISGLAILVPPLIRARPLTRETGQWNQVCKQCLRIIDRALECPISTKSHWSLLFLRTHGQQLRGAKVLALINWDHPVLNLKEEPQITTALHSIMWQHSLMRIQITWATATSLCHKVVEPL